jgi:hypothetical protein
LRKAAANLEKTYLFKKFSLRKSVYLAPLKILERNMEYNKIIAVTGLPGLYELINSKNDGAIIRSLEDNKTIFASSRIHNFSHLESIEVYTVRDNVNLADIFKAMGGSAETLPDTKNNDTVRKYFTKVFPDLDFEKVYGSDMRKMVKWFEVLKKNNIEIKLTEPAAETVEEEEEKEEPVVKQTEKKSKKASASPATDETTAISEEPKKKKAPAKTKKEESSEENTPKTTRKKKS